jgi:hypothetical protein
MFSIYDNIEQPLLPKLQAYLKQAYRADFCVGYFNLRGWRQIDVDIETFEGGDGKACRLLVGMYRLPREELKQALAIGVEPERIDQGQAIRLQILMPQEFRQQLTYGAPSAADEEGLQRLSSQFLSQKLQVKLFLRHPLHAKLYLIYRRDRAAIKPAYDEIKRLCFNHACDRNHRHFKYTRANPARSSPSPKQIQSGARYPFDVRGGRSQRGNLVRCDLNKPQFCLPARSRRGHLYSRGWATRKL